MTATISRPTERPATPYTWDDRQSIFDRIWTHFIVNRAPFGTSPDGRCCYEAGCAIGIFMALEDARACDAQSTSSISGGLLENDDIRPIVHSYFSDDDRLFDLLSGVQTAHDYAAGYILCDPGATQKAYSSFEARLRIIADRHNLTIPE